MGLWRAIDVHVHWIKPLVFLKGLQAANVTESNRVFLVDQDIGGAYRRMAKAILMQSSNGVGQTMEPIQYEPSAIGFK